MHEPIVEAPASTCRIHLIHLHQQFNRIQSNKPKKASFTLLFISTLLVFLLIAVTPSFDPSSLHSSSSFFSSSSFSSSSSSFSPFSPFSSFSFVSAQTQLVLTSSTGFFRPIGLCPGQSFNLTVQLTTVPSSLSLLVSLSSLNTDFLTIAPSSLSFTYADFLQTGTSNSSVCFSGQYCKAVMVTAVQIANSPASTYTLLGAVPLLMTLSGSSASQFTVPLDSSAGTTSPANTFMVVDWIPPPTLKIAVRGANAVNATTDTLLNGGQLTSHQCKNLLVYVYPYASLGITSISFTSSTPPLNSPSVTVQASNPSPPFTNNGNPFVLSGGSYNLTATVNYLAGFATPTMVQAHFSCAAGPNSGSNNTTNAGSKNGTEVGSAGGSDGQDAGGSDGSASPGGGGGGSGGGGVQGFNFEIWVPVIVVLLLVLLLVSVGLHRWHRGVVERNTARASLNALSLANVYLYQQRHQYLKSHPRAHAQLDYQVNPAIAAYSPVVNPY